MAHPLHLPTLQSQPHPARLVAHRVPAEVLASALAVQPVRPRSNERGPVNKRDYNRWTHAQWRGRRVRSLRELRNASAIIPAGTVFTVKGKFGGLELLADACNCCRIQMRISRVPIEDLEMLP